MTIEKIPDATDVPDATWLCKECGERMLYIHDLRCPVCNNVNVVFCPKCEDHFQVSIDE